MRTLNQRTCERCGHTESFMWFEPDDNLDHACPDGVSVPGEMLTRGERAVPGPGEHGKDEQ